MHILTLPVGPLQANCYLLYKNKDVVLIDPGAEAEHIIEFIDSKQLTPKGILLTHGHDDHVGAIDILRQHYHIEAWLHTSDVGWLVDQRYNIGFGIKKLYHHPEKLVHDQDVITLADIDFHVIHTPGHTQGGVCYYVPEGNALFTGDTLFRGTIGRTDFLEGDHASLLHSIHHQLKNIPDETVVYPGHGPTTTMGFERTKNPYFLES